MTTFEINHKNLVDIISGAFYGSPWFQLSYEPEIYKKYKEEGDCLEDVLAKMLLDNKTITVSDIEEEISYPVDKDRIMKGLILIRDKYPEAYMHFMQETGDFFTYDAIIQCALYGEVIYG